MYIVVEDSGQGYGGWHVVNPWGDLIYSYYDFDEALFAAAWYQSQCLAVC